MPKDEIDYSNTVIYKIQCKDAAVTETYVGHTTNFVQRKCAHKRNSNNPSCDLKVYRVIRQNGGWDNWHMEVVAFRNCKDSYEARAVEQEYFETLNATLNSVQPLPSQAKSPDKNKINIQQGKNRKIGVSYHCELCDFHSNDKTMYQRHLNTKKHNANILLTNAKSKDDIMCHCGKSYKHASSFSRHKKTCPLMKHDTEKEKSVKDNVIKPIMTEAEFQTRLVNTLKEIMPQMAQLASTNITNNNITNNVTNNRISNNQINIFLNEKCADAMSIQQFAKQLTFTIDDVLMKKHDALVKVIKQNLRPLEVTERPVHCTNVARRRWHVKDETEGWRKDDGSALVKHVNNSLLQKSPSQFNETFPGWSSQEKMKDDYIQIVTMTTSDMEPKAEARVLTTVGQELQLDNSTIS